MSENTSGITETLDFIRGRLGHSENLKDLLGVPKMQRAADRLRKAITGEGPNFGRTEFVIIPEQADRLNQQIDAARNLLLERGKDGTHDDYKMSLLGTSEELLNLKQLQNLFEDFPENGVGVMGCKDISSKELVKTESLARISVLISEPNQQIDFDVSPNGTYELDILFSKKYPGDMPQFYMSGAKPLAEMTPEEFQVASYCLARYTTASKTLSS